MKTFVKHQIVEMDETKIQRCVLCGEIINDYSNVMFPAGQQLPKGFPPGEVFVSLGNPVETTTYLLEGEWATGCL